MLAQCSLGYVGLGLRCVGFAWCWACVLVMVLVDLSLVFTCGLRTTIICFWLGCVCVTRVIAGFDVVFGLFIVVCPWLLVCGLFGVWFGVGRLRFGLAVLLGFLAL